MWLLSDSFGSFIYLMHLQVSFQLLLALINLLCSYVLVFVWRKLLVPPSHFLCMWTTLVTNCKVYIFICSPQNPKKRKTHNGRGKSSNCCRWGHNRSCCKFEFCLLIVVVFVFASIIVCQELRTKLHLEENGRVEAGKWHLFHSCKLKLKRGKDAERYRERQKAIGERILKLICMPGLLAYQLGNQSAVASRDRYFD